MGIYQQIKKARDELEGAIKVAEGRKEAVVFSHKSAKLLLETIDENYDSGELD
jgi:hypothetical protein